MCKRELAMYAELQPRPAIPVRVLPPSELALAASREQVCVFHLAGEPMGLDARVQ
jgi:hypothetical protein